MVSFTDEQVKLSSFSQDQLLIWYIEELKELIAMHEISPEGGDLQSDTVTIIGATLDLQEKVVRQVGVLLSFFGFFAYNNSGHDAYRQRLHVVH